MFNPMRNSFANRESLRSGRLAQPTSWRIPQSKKQAHKKGVTESRSGLQGKVALLAIKDGNTLAKLAKDFDVHPAQLRSGSSS